MLSKATFSAGGGTGRESGPATVSVLDANINSGTISPNYPDPSPSKTGAPAAKETKPVNLSNSFDTHLHIVIGKEMKKKESQEGVFYLDDTEYRHAPSSLFLFSNKSKLRYNLVWLVTRTQFSIFILLVIFLNSVLMGMRDYLDANDETENNKMIEKFDPYINPIIYTECVAKIIAMGFVSGGGSYLQDGWNVLDFMVVSASVGGSLVRYIDPAQGENAGVAALRTFRLLRPLRLLGRIAALKTLLSTLLSSLQALSATMGLATFIYIVYAIFGMTIWSGVLHNQCYETEFPVDVNGLGEWEKI